MLQEASKASTARGAQRAEKGEEEQVPKCPMCRTEMIGTLAVNSDLEQTMVSLIFATCVTEHTLKRCWW